MLSVLDLVRLKGVQTRADLARLSGLGRTVIAQRIEDLLDRGLLIEGELRASTGGRPARQLRLNAETGHVLVANHGAESLSVGIADLGGTVIAHHYEASSIADGAETVLPRIERLFRQLLERNPDTPARLRGIGIGLPGPVEYASGRPIAPPIMPNWDGFPVRERLSSAFDIPVWVDNEVNTLALGELRTGRARGERDVVYLKISTGIGAGVISAGQLHRGAQGAAGDVGHIAVVDDSNVVCRCGNRGCLEALAGGRALALQAQQAAESGESRFLAEIIAADRTITSADVKTAANHGDATSVRLLSQAGHLIGQTLASIVNFFNPSLVLIGGSVPEKEGTVLAAIRESVYGRSLPLATRDLMISPAPLGAKGGLIGAAYMVVDELLGRDHINQWPDLTSSVVGIQG